mmetsp:Transcript_26267/g.67548  ORF Transcript_26267/g.67548 Transcript_26267/m.67548 type:complete len:206 (+) Transcript_26267:103-720(+)
MRTGEASHTLSKTRDSARVEESSWPNARRDRSPSRLLSSSGPSMFSSAPAAQTCAETSRADRRSASGAIASVLRTMCREATSREMFCSAPAAEPQIARLSEERQFTTGGMPFCLRIIWMHSRSELRLCSAPTARVTTLMLLLPSSSMSFGTAPWSRTDRRPLSWKQMLWMAPAALALTASSSYDRYLISGGRPSQRSTDSTWSRS